MWKRLVFTAVFICIIGVSPSFAEAAIDSNGMPKWFIVTLHDIIQDSYIVEYQPCYETVKKITVISTFPNNDASYLLYRDPFDPCAWLGYTGQFNTHLIYEFCDGKDPIETLYNGVDMMLLLSENNWSFTMINSYGMVEYFIGLNFNFTESYWAYVPNSITTSNPISYPWGMHLYTGGFAGHVIIQAIPYCPEPELDCWITFGDYARLADVYGQENMTLEDLHEIISMWLVEQ